MKSDFSDDHKIEQVYNAVFAGVRPSPKHQLDYVEYDYEISPDGSVGRRVELSLLVKKTTLSGEYNWRIPHVTKERAPFNFSMSSASPHVSLSSAVGEANGEPYTLVTIRYSTFRDGEHVKFTISYHQRAYVRRRWTLIVISGWEFFWHYRVVTPRDRFLLRVRIPKLGIFKAQRENDPAGGRIAQLDGGKTYIFETTTANAETLRGTVRFFLLSRNLLGIVGILLGAIVSVAVATMGRLTVGWALGIIFGVTGLLFLLLSFLERNS